MAKALYFLELTHSRIFCFTSFRKLRANNTNKSWATFSKSIYTQWALKPLIPLNATFYLCTKAIVPPSLIFFQTSLSSLKICCQISLHFFMPRTSLYSANLYLIPHYFPLNFFQLFSSLNHPETGKCISIMP